MGIAPSSQCSSYDPFVNPHICHRLPSNHLSTRNMLWSRCCITTLLSRHVVLAARPCPLFLELLFLYLLLLSATWTIPLTTTIDITYSRRSTVVDSLFACIYCHPSLLLPPHPLTISYMTIIPNALRGECSAHVV